jgi:hypothetical protein
MDITKPQSFALAVLQVVMVLLIIVVTNMEVPQRVELLMFQSRLGALVITAAFWGLALLGLGAILVHPNSYVRLFWACVVSVGGAVAWGFNHAANLELSIFDILSFWEARHEVGRAASLYGYSFVLAGFVAAAGCLAFGAPFISRSFRQRRLTKLSAMIPLLPVVAIAALVYEKQGQGYFAMPKQFSQLSLAGLTAVNIGLNAPEARHDLTLVPADTRLSQIIWTPLLAIH